MAMKIIKTRPLVGKVIQHWSTGVKIKVEYQEDSPPLYDFDGRQYFDKDAIAEAFNILRNHDMLQEVDKGLFEGCGQAFLVVR